MAVSVKSNGQARADLAAHLIGYVQAAEAKVLGFGNRLNESEEKRVEWAANDIVKRLQKLGGSDGAAASSEAGASAASAASQAKNAQENGQQVVAEAQTSPAGPAATPHQIPAGTQIDPVV